MLLSSEPSFLPHPFFFKATLVKPLYLSATASGPVSLALLLCTPAGPCFYSCHACLLEISSQTPLCCLPVGGCQAGPWTMFLIFSAFLLSPCYHAPWVNVCQYHRFGTLTPAYLPTLHPCIQPLALLLHLLNLDLCPNLTLSQPQPELLHDSHSPFLLKPAEAHLQGLSMAVRALSICWPQPPHQLSLCMVQHMFRVPPGQASSLGI